MENLAHPYLAIESIDSMIESINSMIQTDTMIIIVTIVNEDYKQMGVRMQ